MAASHYKHQTKQKVQALVSSLIAHETGLKVRLTKPGARNFTIAFEFITGNLEHHSYLEVNSHEVKRVMKG
jgi:hypothetical protein